jgi:hypothetical protein
MYTLSNKPSYLLVKCYDPCILQHWSVELQDYNGAGIYLSSMYDWAHEIHVGQIY